MLDRRYGQLTDAGGKVKKMEHWLDAAFREMREETRNIIDISVYDALDAECIYDKYRKYVCIFAKASCDDVVSIVERYRNSFKIGLMKQDPLEYLENSHMYVVPEDVIVDLLKRKDDTNRRQKFSDSGIPCLQESLRYKNTNYPTIFEMVRKILYVYVYGDNISRTVSNSIDPERPGAIFDRVFSAQGGFEEDVCSSPSETGSLFLSGSLLQ